MEIRIGIKNSAVVQLKPGNLAFGMCYAVKSTKTREKRVKSMSSFEKDLVPTTKEAIQYLKISQPT